MENISQMSMLEVALMLMEKKRTSQPIRKLIKEVLEMKGIDDASGTVATQLYVDITTSSKFVYMGNEEWDLKSRQSLDEWDKDGASFNDDIVDTDDEDIEDDEDDIVEDEIEDVDDEDIEDDEDDETESDDEDDETETDDEDDDYEDELDKVTQTDDEESDDYMDEEKYGKIMDDYEDLYDKE